VPDILMQFDVAAEPPTVFDALTTEQGLAGWWSTRAERTVPFPWNHHTWHELDPARTRMTLRNRGEPAGFSRLAAPVMERAMRRATTKDLQRLKGILEDS
jgi:hypothetical protein